MHHGAVGVYLQMVIYFFVHDGLCELVQHALSDLEFCTDAWDTHVCLDMLLFYLSKASLFLQMFYWCGPCMRQAYGYCMNPHTVLRLLCKITQPLAADYEHIYSH